MRPSVLGWAFFSPVRLALVCLAVGVVLVGTVTLATHESSDEEPAVRPANTAPARSVAPSSLPPARPSEAVSQDTRREATNTARRFVEVWVSGDAMPGREWHRALEPLTTASLHQGLQMTDPARLPAGHVSAAHLQELGPFAGTAVVTLTGDVVLQVQLVAQHGGWVVSNVQPAGT